MAEELVTRETAEAIVEEKRKSVRKFGEENCLPGDNAKYLANALVEYDMPKIDTSDPVQVEQRIQEYFVHCVERDRKPSVIGMANWIGITRGTLDKWKRGDLQKSTHYDIINRAFGTLEELYVDYMMNGKVNPGAGCFIGKNHFGYRDTIDIAPAAPAPLGDFQDQKKLEERILATVPDDE